jgi:hypothetical protein
MVLRIKRLLYDEGFTIAGARRHLQDPNAIAETQQGAALHSAGEFQLTSPDAHGSRVAPGQLLNRKMLLDLRDSLRAFLTLLERR